MKNGEVRKNSQLGDFHVVYTGTILDNGNQADVHGHVEFVGKHSASKVALVTCCLFDTMLDALESQLEPDEFSVLFSAILLRTTENLRQRIVARCKLPEDQ